MDQTFSEGLNSKINFRAIPEQFESQETSKKSDKTLLAGTPLDGVLAK